VKEIKKRPKGGSGEPPLFPKKVQRYQGSVSRRGKQHFEVARREIAAGEGRKAVSDGDVFEALANYYFSTRVISRG